MLVKQYIHKKVEFDVFCDLKVTVTIETVVILEMT